MGVAYSALDGGTVNSADAFSTTGQLSTGNYVALNDPQHIMSFQHVAPVVKRSAPQAEGPEFAQTLNWIDSLLTQQAIPQMNPRSSSTMWARRASPRSSCLQTA